MSIIALFRKPAPAPVRRVSTHLTPAYEAKRIRELRKARAKFGPING